MTQGARPRRADPGGKPARARVGARWLKLPNFFERSLRPSAFLSCCHIPILISFAVCLRPRLALYCLLHVMDRCINNDLGLAGRLVREV